MSKDYACATDPKVSIFMAVTIKKWRKRLNYGKKWQDFGWSITGYNGKVMAREVFSINVYE